MRALSIIQAVLIGIGVVLVFMFNETTFVIGLGIMFVAWLMAVISGIANGWMSD